MREKKWERNTFVTFFDKFWWFLKNSIKTVRLSTILDHFVTISEEFCYIHVKRFQNIFISTHFIGGKMHPYSRHIPVWAVWPCTRFFIYKHQQLSTEPGWCLFSNRFCPHFHPTPTPIYVLKMHLVESPACINEWIAIESIGTPIFWKKLGQISGWRCL